MWKPGKNYAIGYWIFVILCKILIVINDGLLTFLKFLTAWVLFEAGFGHTWLRSEHSWTVPLVQKQLTFGDLLLIGVSSLLYVLDSLILWVFFVKFRYWIFCLFSWWYDQNWIFRQMGFRVCSNSNEYSCVLLIDWIINSCVIRRHRWSSEMLWYVDLSGVGGYK